MTKIETIAELKRRILAKEEPEAGFFDFDSAYNEGLYDALEEVEKFEAGLRELLKHIRQQSLPPLPEEVLKNILGDAETAGSEASKKVVPRAVSDVGNTGQPPQKNQKEVGEG